MHVVSCNHMEARPVISPMREASYVDIADGVKDEDEHDAVREFRMIAEVEPA